MRTLSLLFSLLLSINTFAFSKKYPQPPGPPAGTVEPAYCHVDELKNVEVKSNISGLNRAHVYKVGNVTLVGLGVGFSATKSVIQLAQKFSSTNASEGYCTFYYNASNEEAAKAFIWNNIPKPNSNPANAMKDYVGVLPNLGGDKNSMVNCANNRGYISLGCDGMRHRGPTVMAMLLAYSGCSPETSVITVNAVWGANGINPLSRLELAREAAKYGAAHPVESQRLQQQFLGLAH